MPGAVERDLWSLAAFCGDWRTAPSTLNALMAFLLPSIFQLSILKPRMPMPCAYLLSVSSDRNTLTNSRWDRRGTRRRACCPRHYAHALNTIYTRRLRDRLLFLRQTSGFSLDEVRELLALADRQQALSDAVDSLVAEHLRQVRQRLASLQARESELQRLLLCCQGEIFGVQDHRTHSLQCERLGVNTA